MIDSLDPAHKRIALLGMPSNWDASRRVSEAKQFAQTLAPQLKVVDADNIFKGPHNARTMTKNTYLEFNNRDAAKAFLAKIVDGKAQLSGNSVAVKPALTKINGRRNYSLRKAEE